MLPSTFFTVTALIKHICTHSSLVSSWHLSNAAKVLSPTWLCAMDVILNVAICNIQQLRMYLGCVFNAMRISGSTSGC